MKKNIRLKEQQSLISVTHIPKDIYCETRPKFDKTLQYKCNTDSDGFIKSGNYISSSKKIFIMGGSFVESMYSTEYLRMCSFLERELSLHNFDYQVYNAGVSGTTSLNILNTLLNKIIPYKPSVVIVFIPTNDVYANNYSEGFWNRTKRFGNIAPPSTKSNFDNILTDGKIKDTVNIYKLIHNICELFGIKLIISASPFVDNIDDEFYKIPLEGYLNACSKRKILYKAIFEFCEEAGIAYFESKSGVDKNIFYDDVHLNDKGGQIYSNLIFNNVKQFIQKSDTPLCKEYSIEDIEILNDNTIWNSIASNEYDIDHIVLYYMIDCNEEAIQNNALFCLDFEDHSAQTLAGLRYSSSVGFFNYLNTGKNLKVGCSLKFSPPTSTKNFKIGFRSWHKPETVKIKNIKIVIFYR